MVGEKPIPSAIHSIVPQRLRSYVRARCADGKLLFSLPSADFSTSNQRWIGPRASYNIFRWSCSVVFKVIDVNYPTIISKKRHHQLESCGTHLAFIRSRFPRKSPLFRMFFSLWYIVLDASIVRSYKTARRVFLIAIEHRQILPRNGQTAIMWK